MGESQGVRLHPQPITIEDLSVSRNGARILDGVTFALGPGTVHGLVGPNGSGKSTLLHALAGLVAHGGRTSHTGPVSIMTGQPGYHPARRLVHHVRLTARQPGIDVDRLAELVERLELTALLSRPPSAMSLGQQRAVSLLAPLATRADLVLLDEPFLALDAARVRTLEALVRERAAGGDTVLVSSHEPEPLSRTATHVLSLESGEVVFHGTMAELLAATRPFRVRLRVPDAGAWRRALADERYAASSEDAPDGLLVHGATMAGLLRVAHLRGLPLTGIWEEQPTLEEALSRTSARPSPDGVREGV